MKKAIITKNIRKQDFRWTLVLRWTATQSALLSETRTASSPVFPLRTCLDCRGVAGERGTTTLQPTTAGSSSTSSTRRLHRKRSRSIPSSGGSDAAYGGYTHKYVHNQTLNIKEELTLQILSHKSYRLVFRVRTSKAQLRWQLATVASDPTQKRPGLSPAHLPRLQRCRRGERHHDAATDHRRL